MILSLICTDLRDCSILPVPVLGSSEFLGDDSVGVRWRNLMTSSLYSSGDCGPLLPGSVPGSVLFPEEDPGVAEKSHDFVSLQVWRLWLPGSVPGSVRVSGGGPWRGGEIS